MNTCGIITEYNPMHLGHAYQLNEGKSVTASERTVLVMSGNFVQRGEPAIINKYARAKAALKTGIDLVIELPAYFATSSAEYFSHHAVALLEACGVVTHMNYGSESGSLEGLQAIADILYKEPLGFKVLLNDLLAEGHSYPKAREMALLKYNDNHDIIDSQTIKMIQTPNNILGIEYLKALKRLDSTIQPTTIKRIGATYHDEDSHTEIPSATAIRRHIMEGKAIEDLESKMPSASYDALYEAATSQCGPVFYKDIYCSLKYKLLTTPKEELTRYMDVTEGLENRIHDVAMHTGSYDELLDGVVSKRYTRTKIARALLHIYLGHTKETFEKLHNDMSPYLRILGFTDSGKDILRDIKNTNEDLPVIVNVKQGYKQLDPLQRLCYEADLRSTLLYNHLIQIKYGISVKNDYQSPVIMV